MNITHPLIKPNTMEARIYQQTMVANALRKNTLCVLGTGLGKTAIATLTIAGILSKNNNKNINKKVLIIAPSRPLVEQHYNSLKTFLNIPEDKIVVLTGKIAPAKRQKIWEEGKIFIATPQIVENDIVANRVNTDDFALLIADEAHHTTGNHSYSFVASVFRNKSHILGLTASPGSNIEKILEVCKNLGIEHVEIRTIDDIDVKEYVQTVKLRPIKVELPKEFAECINLLKQAQMERLKILRDHKIIYSTNVNKTELLQLQKRIMVIEDNSKYELIKIASEAIKLDYAIETLECQGKEAFLNYYERLSSQDTKSAKAIIKDSKVLKVAYSLRTTELEHPKTEKLLEVVNDVLNKEEGKKEKKNTKKKNTNNTNNIDNNNKTIIFAQYRDTVEKIVNLLNSNGIQAIPFVGQSNKDGKGMSQKKQIEAVEKFKNDPAVNVLVSTSVSEEGIDIMSVNFVIFYEPVPSEIRFIQRRGRASRGEGGECIVLITKDSRDEGYYWSALNKERKMKRILKDMQKILNEKLNEENAHKYIIEDKNTIDYHINKENNKMAEKENNKIGDTNGKISIEEDCKNNVKKEIKENINEIIENKNNIVLSNKCSTKPVKIIVDSREKIISRYIYDKADLEFKALDNGDFILSDRVIVERKTAEDLEGSIIDKRLFKQLKDLKKYERPILIVEGNDYFRLSEKIINGTMVSIMLDFNIPVIFTKDMEETANILIKMAEREQLRDKRTISIRTGKKPMSLKERQRFIVESFPDIGALMAENLLIKFGTIENIVKASVEELREVEGIGEITAKKIKSVLTEKYEK
ncbi:DEAD/DEAH box helicase domain protein [Methanococcus aeolicus Nankai-3]|uniref:DEAD/DEAH box helicase domain protein n=1 Tax=Methanococcus aeolicus (strain ATCC BAA-1280 / DSM 17508 / OCM 812 / Nankai-3) TaxID=419665 RepID=A6UTA1_META3|nr:DEAD/DEAH box helicase [Methanococcus aeolicus]ABR55723.1 DEAD/DEAH box helicase domain protein [Methanococcus aeolicus Nankai-3]